MPDDFMPRTASTAADRPAPAWAKKPPPKSKAHRRPAKITARKYPAPRNPHHHARKIAERVLDAWYQNFGGSSIDIPLGTVAALTLLRNVPGLADFILNLKPHELPQLFKEIYLGHWLNRPDLINRAIPLHDWAWNPDPDKQQLRAVHAVTHTAINTGLMDLTGHDDPCLRAETDVLSPLLTGLRHKSDKKWRGEYHTPPELCDLMARMLIDKDTAPGMSFLEPALGSGTMFRSAAQQLRDLDLNPHDFHWYGNDIDALSAGCAAINTILWDLGPHAHIGCADSLALEDGGYAKTREETKEAFEQRDRYLDTAHTIVAARRAFRLIDELTGAAA